MTPSERVLRVETPAQSVRIGLRVLGTKNPKGLAALQFQSYANVVLLNGLRPILSEFYDSKPTATSSTQLPPLELDPAYRPQVRLMDVIVLVTGIVLFSLDGVFVHVGKGAWATKLLIAIPIAIGAWNVLNLRGAPFRALLRRKARKASLGNKKAP